MNQSMGLLCVARLLLKPHQCIRSGVPIRSIHRHMRAKLQSLNTRKREEAEKYPRPPTPRYAFSDWNYNAEIYAFGKRLHEPLDENVLRQAFTSRSFVIEQTRKQEELGLSSMDLKDNEIMSSEGRTLLHNTLHSTLKEHFPKFPTVGVESVVNHLTSQSFLANISSLIGTKDLILSNEYPPSEETLARTFLAIISAVQKSSGTLAAETFIKHFVLSFLLDKDINDLWDIPKPWTMLTDIMNQKGETLEPRLLRESGRNSLLSVFVVGLYDSKKQLLGTGIGETVDIAVEMAARDTLKGIFNTKNSVHNLKLN